MIEICPVQWEKNELPLSNHNFYDNQLIILFSTSFHFSRIVGSKGLHNATNVHCGNTTTIKSCNSLGDCNSFLLSGITSCTDLSADTCNLVLSTFWLMYITVNSGTCIVHSAYYNIISIFHISKCTAQGQLNICNGISLILITTKFAFLLCLTNNEVL